MAPPKVILDTDPGIDDAVACIMLLEGQKEGLVEMVAITTVAGNTTLENCNTNALKILHMSDANQIPVYAGCSGPLAIEFTGERTDPPFHGYDGLGDAKLSQTPKQYKIEDEFAALAIIRIVEENPGEVILCAIGPLTNIAMAINIKPDFTSKLKALYIMGGNTTGLGNITITGEFNFYYDPEAAKVVLDRSLIPIHVVPLEVCVHGVEISKNERRKLGEVNTKNATFFNKIDKMILEDKMFSYWPTFDQLASAWVLDDQRPKHRLVTKSKAYRATVATESELTRGMMVVDHRNIFQDDSKPHNIIAMLDVHKEVYLSYLKLAFGKPFIYPECIDCA